MTMRHALLVGETDGGRCSMIVEDATWRTIASVADGLTAASHLPIIWRCFEVKSPNVNRALIEVGLGDVPVTTPVPVAV